MKTILGMLAVCVALAGCEKRSVDGLSNAGAIHPLTEAAKPLVSRDNLTDALALQTTLEGIAKRAPPVGDANSQKAWQQFYDAERAKIAPSKADYLLPVTCGAQENTSLGPLSYIKSVKNIVVRIYNGQPNQDSIIKSASEKAFSMLHLIHLKLEAELISGHMIEGDLQEIPQALADQLRDLEIQSSSLVLPSGVIIMTDSPIGEVGVKMELAVAEANDALVTQESHLINTGRLQGEDVGAPISKEIDQLELYPDGILTAPFWMKEVPTTHAPETVCLLVRFGDLDLTDMPWITPFRNPKAKLIGLVKAWYLVDKTSLAVLAHEKNAPASH